MSSLFNWPNQISTRLAAMTLALYCAFLLAFAYVLEYFVDLVPCPLCIVQRFFFFLIFCVALAHYFWPAQVTAKIAGIKITAFALLGGAVAGRQIWMQWYPNMTDPTRCGVSFGSFLDQVLLALGGRGNCSLVDWTFLTLSIAEWSFLAFVFLTGAGLWMFWKNKI